jgi:uncharacterized protein (DUF1697 family)
VAERAVSAGESAAERYVAFLRGINLGKRRPPMSRLRALFREMAFEDVETFIASGNVLFASRGMKDAAIEAMIARCLEESLGYPVDTFVRTTEEVIAIGRAKMFPEDSEEGMTIHVGFLHEELAPEMARRLTAIGTARDAFRVKAREFYWLCRGRMSDSKVWTSPEVKALRLPTSSMRNITSIRKLIAKHLA